ncbi:MAG: hypothetical protein IJY39_11685 [Clostridia bacterium]|nr:hypothetical protein [Clostridia bacterium]
MKKAIAILLTVTALLCSCSGIDHNLAREDNVYDEMVEFINHPDQYVGKTVKLSATHSVVYSFSQNKILRHVLVESSPSGAKRAIYEIRTEDNAYPLIGNKITVTGSFCEGNYILVDSFDVPTFESTVDIDALDLSPGELKELITSFRSEYQNSEYFESFIRIFGHCVVSNGYYYLLGLDETGSMTWDIELYDPDKLIGFGDSQDNSLNPVEVTGTLTIYFEDNLAYACIKVHKIKSVEGSLS